MASKKLKHIKKYIPLYIMMLPGLLYLLINNYLPMAGLVIAFKDVDYRKGIFGSDWIGFKNFEYLFSTEDAWVITRNTMGYNIAFILINTTLSVIVAILLSEMISKGAKRFYQSAILLPFLLSMVIIGYLGNAMMNTELGFLNKTILPLFGAEPVQWYMEPKLWVFILPFVYAWKEVGYLSIIYYSAVLGIDTEYYEAASLEGASKLQQIYYITIPLIKPVIYTMVLLSIGKIFRSDFGLFYHVPLNSGALYSTTNVIDTYVYRGLMQLGDIGMSSAAGAYQAVVGFLFVLASNLIVRKTSPENALF
ncbi:MAG: ABC transporter permease subunit [Oscillospiraceae bacterium]|jgi:putative aldouronate transport system permease protein|nr:ABC transporter permease subunit [Oscillospiraceae bacterium]